MGEYAFYNNESVKIGTCDSMYYLRYEDRRKVRKQEGSLDAATTMNLRWRLPFADEDHMTPGTYENYRRGERLWSEDDRDADNLELPEDLDPGIIQLSHPSGLLVNVKCYHGRRKPEGGADMKTHWNGKSWSLELVHIKNTPEGIKPVVGCRHCGHMWRFEWSEIMPYLHGEMKARLSFYAR